ncbi:hypothetical protein CYLTODRAFT_488158 [Cylindrobasidium torrendii FP15055 ss-10]|uniref:Uncharacterized protein n=1 Tax=Cylindrobasidium torrendii FP15055 ss-10 TaxID=1314674 RepID=A0A0D7BIH7_9AGAR|nr:hypothetical protein CYLTODRAFT_488158 [Cylindrobasidium torrendii FP15055 ss-10]
MSSRLAAHYAASCRSTAPPSPVAGHSRGAFYIPSTPAPSQQARQIDACITYRRALPPRERLIGGQDLAKHVSCLETENNNLRRAYLDAEHRARLAESGWRAAAGQAERTRVALAATMRPSSPTTAPKANSESACLHDRLAAIDNAIIRISGPVQRQHAELLAAQKARAIAVAKQIAALEEVDLLKRQVYALKQHRQSVASLSTPGEVRIDPLFAQRPCLSQLLDILRRAAPELGLMSGPETFSMEFLLQDVKTLIRRLTSATAEKDELQLVLDETTHSLAMQRSASDFEKEAAFDMQIQLEEACSALRDTESIANQRIAEMQSKLDTEEQRRILEERSDEVKRESSPAAMDSDGTLAPSSPTVPNVSLCSTSDEAALKSRKRKAFGQAPQKEVMMHRRPGYPPPMKRQKVSSHPQIHAGAAPERGTTTQRRPLIGPSRRQQKRRTTRKGRN